MAFAGVVSDAGFACRSWKLLARDCWPGRWAAAEGRKHSQWAVCSRLRWCSGSMGFCQ